MTALCAALIMVPFLRRWALDKGTVDLPDERKVHSTPMPRLGGIAIFIAVLFSSLIFAPPSIFFRGLLAGSLVVFATGIADDLYGLSSKQKFFGDCRQAAASSRHQPHRPAYAGHPAYACGTHHRLPRPRLPTDADQLRSGSAGGVCAGGVQIKAAMSDEAGR